MGYRADPDATLPLTQAYPQGYGTPPAYTPPPPPAYRAGAMPQSGWPAGQQPPAWNPTWNPGGSPGQGGWPAGQMPPGSPGWGAPPAWGAGMPPQGPWGPGAGPAGTTPTGGWPTGAWGNETPDAGTAYGGRPPAPPAAGTRRGTPGNGGGDGPGRTPPAVIIGSVIGVAAILAIAVWVLLLRPMDGGTASATPGATAGSFVTPPPTATPEPDVTQEPFIEPSVEPEATRFRNPTFKGLKVRDAEQLAQRSNITVDVTYEVTDQAEPDTVIDQDPSPGSDLFPGDIVTLTVAAQQPTVAVPDLRGFSEDDAVSALLDAGLTPGQRSEANDDSAEAGTILRTDPRRGVSVARGTTVDYTVSLGRAPAPSAAPEATPIPAPDLVGLSEDEARSVTEDLGLGLDVQPQDALDAEPGTVLGQDPETDTPLQPGDRITVTVAQRPATVDVPDVRDMAEADALSALMDAGLQPGQRSETASDSVARGDIVRTDPRGGIQVAPGTEVDFVVSTGPEAPPSEAPTQAPAIVPGVVGMTVDDARGLVRDAGLEIDIQERETLDTPEGTVLDQDPPADSQVPSGSRVTIVVAVRPGSIAVPVLRGLTEDDALAALSTSSLVPGERTERTHAVIPAGSVIRSDPAAGTIVALDTAVDYVVSLGPPASPSPVVSPSPALVTVPTLRGLSEEDGVSLLIEAGLEPGDRVPRYNDTIAEGAIVRTDPAADEQVPAGTRVDLIVSRGPEPSPAPELVGQPLEQAQALAEQNGFTIEVTEQESTDAPDGTILDQDPRSGDPMNGTVRVVVARNTRTVTVPELRAKPEDEARQLLVDAGLVPGERSERYNDNVRAGFVVRSDPPRDTEVRRGSTVDYVVSLGDAPDVPELSGQPLEQAQVLAEGAGLKLDISYEDRTDTEPDTVLGQDPTAGSPAPADGTIRVTVSRAPSTVIVPRVRGLSEEEALAQLRDAGLEIGERTERTNADIEAGLVLGTDPRANSEVAPGTPVDYVVSLGPDQGGGDPSQVPPPDASPVVDPGQGIDRATAAAIDEVAAGVVQVREQRLSPIAAQALRPKAFQNQVRAAWDAAHPADELAKEEGTLKRLGLIPPDGDLRSGTVRLLESNVPAWYDPDTDTLSIIDRDGSFDAAERLFTAGALASALQDQHQDLATLRLNDASQTDRLLARQALQGGEVTQVMVEWGGAALTQDEQAQFGSATPADPDLLARMPAWTRRVFQFPSGAGQAFVEWLRQSGGWAAVDAAWQEPPTTTEQVLHPEKYGVERQTKLDVPNLRPTLGQAWRIQDERTLGELGIGIWLDNGQADGTNAWAADGWDGDRLQRWETADGDWLIAWQTTWDTDTDAGEFASTADAVASGLPAHAVLRGADLTGSASQPVLVLLASSQAPIDALTGLTTQGG